MRSLHLLVVSALTLSRVPAAVVSALYLLSQDWDKAWGWYFYAVGSDAVDGQLARRWKVTTRFGELADVHSDNGMFFVFIPSVYIYGQLHSAWWASNLSPSHLPSAIGFLVVVGGLGLLTNIGRRLFQWFLEKGRIWTGLGSVASVGVWVACQAGWVQLVMLLLYGTGTIILNRKKLATWL